MDKNELFNKLKDDGILKSKNIKEALKKVDRADFVTPENKDYAYADIPLPTMSGQTISQPATVVFMLEKLELKRGQSVLEIGFGSGWVTALIAEIIGPTGKIDAFEVLENVYRFGKNNLEKYNYKNIKLFNQSIIEYLSIKKKDYNRIISGAAFSNNLDLVKTSLGDEGVAIIPLKKNSILKLTKINNGVTEENYHGFVFVPLK